MAVQQTSVKNKKSYQLSGYLGGAGSYIGWTGTATENIDPVANIVYTGYYSAYYGALASLAAVFNATTWSNTTLQGLGAPYMTYGLGVWAGQLNTTATETIAYAFTSPVPAGASFMLVDPGASYQEYSGTEVYRITAANSAGAVSTSGWSFSIQSPTGGVIPASALTIDAASGTITVRSYALSAWPDAVIVITPNVAITSISVTANTIPFDFWGLTLPHIPAPLLFQYGNTGSAMAGSMACWQLNGVAIAGGGGIGNPGASWYYEGSGDFQGNGGTGILFRNVNGTIAYWTVSGTSIVSVGTIGNPGGTWNIIGVGDFNADGRSDILFEDGAHNFALWLMNGASIIGGGNLFSPGPSWRYAGTGDFNGDGYNDILFQNTSGQYAEWLMKGTTISKVVTLVAGPAGSACAGVGDFNGDGISDILFDTPATSQYSAWLMNTSGAIASTVTLCTPGVNATLVSVGAYTASAASDLIFENSGTGVLSEYFVNNGAATNGGDIGSPGPFFWVARAPYAAVPPAPTLFLANAAGDLMLWNIAFGVNQSSATLRAALSGWTFVAAGDFEGNRGADYLTVNSSGNYAIWETRNGQIVGAGTIGGPGAGWSYRGVGDFNGDGAQDILFQDSAGGYAAWLLNGAQVIGGGSSLGNPGPGYTVAAIADLTGSGTSDIVFTDGAGNYSVWFYDNNTLVNSAYLGNVGAGYTLIGSGDFNGDGRADLLFQSAANSYKTWDLNCGTIVGGGTFSGPGTAYAYVGVAELTGNGCASILFRNTATGAIVADNMFDTTVASFSNFGIPAPGFTVAAVI